MGTEMGIIMIKNAIVPLLLKTNVYEVEFFL